MDLPMGGLLSELLASEGIDPANLIEAGAAPASTGGCRIEPAPVRPTSPPTAAPPAGGADPDAADPALWACADVAMPGLFADLMHIDEAARDARAGEPFSSSPSGLAMPGLFSQLTSDEALDESPGHTSVSAGIPPSEEATSTQLPDAEVPGSAPDELIAGPGRPELNDSAVPELYALLTDGAEPSLAAADHGCDSEPSSAAGPHDQDFGELVLTAAPAPGQAKPAVPEEVAPPGEGSEASGKPGIASLAIPELYSLLSAEIETGSPSMDSLAVEPKQVVPAQQDAQPVLPEPGATAMAGLSGESAAAHPVETVDAAFEQPAAGLPAAGEFRAENVIAEEDAAPEAGLSPDPHEALSPAAMIAGAYRPSIGGPAAGDGPGSQNELSALIDQIDSEISASPMVSSETQQTSDQDFERFVVFRLAGNSYGLHMKLVREVEKAGRVTAVPSAPSILRGLINLRGEILPLIDPRPLLGLDPAAWAGGGGGYLVVVQARGDGSPVALLVDELGGVAPVDPASVQPVYRSNDLRDVLTGHVLGQAEHRGRSVLLLDHRRLITDEALLNAVEGSRMELEEAGR